MLHLGLGICVLLRERVCEHCSSVRRRSLPQGRRCLAPGGPRGEELQKVQDGVRNFSLSNTIVWFVTVACAAAVCFFF